MKTVFRVLMLAGLFASTAMAAPFQNGSFESAPTQAVAF